MSHENKDFSSVSPSAKSLLMMKGYTTIPYAKETAALMHGPEAFGLNFDDKDFWFWVRVMHFESRYLSISQLLQHTGSRNILELSSGYSLRGLDLCVKDPGMHYIDTDLPEVIATKLRMIEQLQLMKDVQGNLELLPLNAMDPDEFATVASRFGDSEFTIVNEGLLMYLNLDEKKQLCKTIHHILSLHGGYWITADVYVRRTAEAMATIPQSAKEAAFFEQHHIEENKFEDYDVARTFFKEQGFELIKEAEPNYHELSVMPQLLKVLPEEARNSNKQPPRIQATWMLKAI